MKDTGFALFETAIGHCGIAWGPRGLLGLQLPEATKTATRARMRSRFDGVAEAAPPRRVMSTIAAIAKLLSGRHVELDHVELDMEEVPPFHRRVYEAARRIPPGRTASYGEVATRVGSPGASRAVGQAMRRNPFPIVVPCHRVLASSGKAGGFTAPGGVDTKLRMLEIEGAGIVNARATARALIDGAKKSASSRGPAKPTVVAKPASVAKPSAGSKPSAVAKLSSGAKPSSVVKLAAAKPAALPAGRSVAPAVLGASKTAAGDGLAFDPRRAVRELKAADARLASLIDRVGPPAIRVRTTASVFGALAESIVYQQLTGKAAATIYGRVCALFPRAKNGFGPRHILDVDDASLRGAGLSGAKVAALRDLAAKTEAREVPTLSEVQRMDDADIVAALTGVRGIGQWTVEMLLIFRLGRPDVLPVGDYGVRKGFAVTYGWPELPTPKELAGHGEAWRPWRTVASWYMWRAADAAKQTA